MTAKGRKESEAKAKDVGADELYGSELDDLIGGADTPATISGFTRGDPRFAGVNNDTLEFSTPTNDKPLKRRSK